MRAVLIIVAALTVIACSKIARATSCGDITQPPQAFDHAPDFPVIIREEPYADITAACLRIGLKMEVGFHYWACNRLGGGLPPLIILSLADGVNFSRAEQDCLLHHEWGHLNRADPDHRGWRFL